jgi:superfamily II DNA or RNA helicase
MTTDLLRLRPYQAKALDVVEDHLLRRELQRFAVVAPTGSGKTVQFAHLANLWMDPDYAHVRAGLPARVLILVHRDELVTQAVDKLRQVAPGVPVGVVKGPQNDIYADIIVASVQTIMREHRLDQLMPTGLVIVDECHHASALGYRAVMERLGCYPSEENPAVGAVAVGFTATMARGDGQGLGDVWQEVVFRLDILDLIEQGHLVDVAGRRVTVDGLTLENVAQRGGDYAPTSLSEALMSADAMRVTADAYVKYAKDRSGIVFVPNVEAVHAFVDEFNTRGLTTTAIWGAMPADRRREALEAFKAGRIQVLVNCAVLTEGFDAPIASCAVIARPTLSAALYVQMVGRVLRPYPGKDDALVLDVAGASEMHQLATLADLSSRRLDEVAEGESLTAAVRREREAGNPRLADYVVDSYEVDLFRRSEALWLQTKAGVWFTTARDNSVEDPNARDQIYFLWPGSEPDLYRVGKRPTHVKGGTWIAEDVPFNVAQEWAEQAALEDDAANKADGGPSLALKNASWRKGRTPATDDQKTKLTCLGVTPRDGITKREASDLISIELASRVLDQAIAGRE